jgi:HAD superfamily phosphoserine phosphatase-like hydrolase
MKQLQKRKVRALAVLDMDGTLLESRSIDVLCQKFELETKLREIDRRTDFLEDYKISEAIAQLFAGMKASDMERVFDGISMVHGAKEFTGFLKEKKFLTVIITDSYIFLASRLAEKLGIDIVWGNKLEIVDDIITGKITMPLGWEKQKNCQKKAVCKLHAMYKLVQKHEIGMDKTLAIGDSKSDFCMIKKAAVGVAFRPKDPEIVKIADLVVYEDFFELIGKLKPFLDRF